MGEEELKLNEMEQALAEMIQLEKMVLELTENVSSRCHY